MDVTLNRKTNDLVLKSAGVTQYIWNVAGLDSLSNCQHRILSTKRFNDGEYKQIGIIFGNISVKERWE